MLTNKLKKKTALNDQIDDTHAQLDREEVGTPKHDQLMTVLERLYKIKKDTTSDRVDASTKATIAANLAGIVLIMSHEQTRVISTKALGFIIKPKV